MSTNQFRGRAVFADTDAPLVAASDELWRPHREEEPILCKPLRGRTRKKMVRVKRKHRTDISPDEWGKYKYHRVWPSCKERLINGCTGFMQGIHAHNFNLTEFQTHFERKSIPCIIHGLADEWRAKDNWTYRHLRDTLGERRFKCGEDDDGYALKVKLKHFFRYQADSGSDGAKTDDSPLYIFDSHFDDDKVSKALTTEYAKPKLFNEDLFQLVGEKRRPPYRWVLFGPERSGSNVHLDPLGTSAWNTLIRGRKLWVLLPPHINKRLVKAKHLMRKGEDDEPLDWFINLLPRLLDEGGDDVRKHLIQFIQYPGETVYVPSNWWHSVLNLDDTIAVTQNYASTGNFDIVWRATRVGRKRMARKWLSELDQVRPDLGKLAREIDRQDGFDLDKIIKEADDKRAKKKSKKQARDSDSDTTDSE